MTRNKIGFQLGKSTVDVNFALRQLQEIFGAKKKELFLVFVDLEKAFDCVLREANRRALRRPKVPQSLILLPMALYSNTRSRFGSLAGTSAEFGIGVAVH